MADAAPNSRRLWLAVSSHGWEDFPAWHTGREASELLAGWTALFHPCVLGHNASAPNWTRMDQLPDPVAGAVIAVPAFSRDQFSDSLRHRLSDLGGVAVEVTDDRAANVAQLLESTQTDKPDASSALIDHFYSLGYCYLQIQLMTRQLRYVSTLEERDFSERLRAATAASLAGNTEATRAGLQACFDLLIEERMRYYPTSASLLDVVYVHRLGPPEIAAIASYHHPFTLQIPGTVASAASAAFPEVAAGAGNGGHKDSAEGSLASADWRAVLKGIEDSRIAIAASTYGEPAASVVGVAALLDQLLRSRQAIRDAFPVNAIANFCSRRFVLGEGLPQLLRMAGFSHAVHASLDDGIYPQTTSNVINWEGDDGTRLAALATPPRLAHLPESWLRLGPELGEAIDANHYASALFVHWPGQDSDSYRDLITSRRYGEVLGQWVTLDTYFEQASDPGYSQHYAAGDYVDPLIRSADVDATRRMARDLRRWWGQYWLWQSARGLAAMLHAVGGDFADQGRLNELHNAWIRSVDSLGMGPTKASDSPSADETELAELIQGLGRQFVATLGFQLREVAARDGDDATFELVLNAVGTSQLPPAHLSATARIPAWGFGTGQMPEKANSGEHRKASATRRRQTPLIGDDTTLQNEFFRLNLHKETGGIRALHRHASRHSLVSQQLGIRIGSGQVSRSGGARFRYARAVAKTLNVDNGGPETASATADGALMDGERRLGEFRQVTRVRRGSPIVELEWVVTSLSDSIDFSRLWTEYVACRFAWAEDNAPVDVWQHEARRRVKGHRFLAPVVFEVGQQPEPLVVITDGHLFHQKIGHRQLDCVLQGHDLQGTEIRCRLGIGVGIQNPWQAATLFHCPPLPVACRPSSRTDSHSGWVFYGNRRNVVAVDWELLPDAPSPDEQADRPLRGSRVLLRETEGRACVFELQCCRPIVEACRITGDGTRGDVVVIDGKVQLELGKYEFVNLEIRWKA